MFISATLDTWPEHSERVISAIRRCGLDDQVTVNSHAYNDGVLNGTQFNVSLKNHAEQPRHHNHTHYHQIEKMLVNSTLSESITRHALGIFKLLAEAESQVHGIPVEEVAFHEVGAWDSIADIVGAACLIDALEPADWSCTPLPLGNGQV